MKKDLLTFLECPSCRGAFELSSGSGGNGRDQELVCSACRKRVPVHGSIPRFVPSDQYAASFSFEWNRFRTTQMDSANPDPESEKRLQQSLDRPLETLRGRRVLDAGCGAGRFAEVVLRKGGRVVGVDLSFAIDAAYRNLKEWENLDLIQADLTALPLRADSFDFIYSLGVLHHTPNAKTGFLNLVRLLKPGGQISITLYSGYNKFYVRSSQWWRQWTTRLPHSVVHGISTLAIPLYFLYRLPVVGDLGQGLFPISMHPKAQWRVLDTYDCYTPRYQSYHTHYEVFRWFEEAGLREIKVLEPGISLIGRKP